MNDREQNHFENELRRLKPAQPPRELIARLTERCPVAESERVARRPAVVKAPSSWGILLRWLIPAAATAAIAALLISRPSTPGPKPPRHDQAAVQPQETVNPDAVEIDRELVRSFDAVAQLADGAPVRLRCREWADKVTFRDKTRGLIVERSTPRLEIVPVRYEMQ